MKLKILWTGHLLSNPCRLDGTVMVGSGYCKKCKLFVSSDKYFVECAYEFRRHKPSS